MKYGIITPTFKDHFCYVEKYLESFDKFVVDKENVKIVFTISKSELKEFNEIVKKYKKINYEILLFEDLLKKYGVNYSSEKLLAKYGKFTFQTMKKFYSMLESDCEKFLVLDSESMWIRKTSMVQLFEDFFKSPFISISDINKRSLTKKLITDCKYNVNKILDKDCNMWFIENFVWFYDKTILQNLFKEHGSLLEMAELAYQNDINSKVKAGIFEIILYQNYIYNNTSRYNYNVINADLLLQENLSEKAYTKYLEKFNKRYKGGCGVLERATDFLDHENYSKLANMFIKYRYNIIRLEKIDKDAYNIQKDFLNIAKTNILAASQDHAFGVNNAFKLLYITNDKTYLKYQKHVEQLKEHFSHIPPAIREIFSCSFYCLIWSFKKLTLYIKFIKYNKGT